MTERGRKPVERLYLRYFPTCQGTVRRTSGGKERGEAFRQKTHPSRTLVRSLRNERESIMNTYDSIVIGAGQAGSVVATRLSEDKNVQELPLEVGRQDWQ